MNLLHKEIIHPNLIKMSLPCSRCKNLIQLECYDENFIKLECEYKVMDDSFENISIFTKGCSNYEEDLDILRICLNSTEEFSSTSAVFVKE